MKTIENVNIGVIIASVIVIVAVIVWMIKRAEKESERDFEKKKRKHRATVNADKKQFSISEKAQGLQPGKSVFSVSQS